MTTASFTSPHTVSRCAETTLPDIHVLAGSNKDRLIQIGNAVPSTFMAQVFEEVIKVLQKSDEEAEAWEKEVLTID